MTFGSPSARMSLVRRPATFFDENVILALGGGLGRQVFGLDALLAREPGDRLRRRGFRRTLDPLFAIGLPLGETVGAQHEAARRRVERHGVVRDLQLFEQQAQVFQRVRNHPIGNFFRADLEQEREAHCATSAAATRLLLVGPGLRDSDRQLAHALDHADALGDADRAARIERIKQVRALQHVVVGGKQGEALLLGRLRIVQLEQARGLALVQVEQLP